MCCFYDICFLFGTNTVGLSHCMSGIFAIGMDTLPDIPQAGDCIQPRICNWLAAAGVAIDCYVFRYRNRWGG